GRYDEALPLVADAVRRPTHIISGFIRALQSAGTAYLLVGQIAEAASHVREALAISRRVGARGSEAYAQYLAGDIALASGAEDAEGYYRQALALAEPRGMRPLVAHCHLGRGKLHRRTSNHALAREHLTTAIAMYREMGMAYWLEQADAEMRQLG